VPGALPRVAASLRTLLTLLLGAQMGVDDRAEYEDLSHFVDVVTSASGVTRVTVHARAALLGGLSTSANRRVPPLRHAEVYRLKRDFPRLEVTLNGGVETLAQAREHLQHVDGVMLGRALQRNPLLLADVDAELFGDDAPAPQLSDVLHAYRAYVDDQVTAAGPADDAFHARKTRQRANKPLQLAALAREVRSRGLAHLLPGGELGDAADDGEAADDAEDDAPCAEATA
jgi:tRNA-dihydrouridine synthase